jgi:hypothetical protein
MQQLTLFPDSDVQTDGYAQPEPRDNEQDVEEPDQLTFDEVGMEEAA